MARLDPLLALHALIETRCTLWLRGQLGDDEIKLVKPLYGFNSKHKIGLTFDQIDDMVLDELSRQQSHGHQAADH